MKKQVKIIIHITFLTLLSLLISSNVYADDMMREAVDFECSEMEEEREGEVDVFFDRVENESISGGGSDLQVDDYERICTKFYFNTFLSKKERSQTFSCRFYNFFFTKLYYLYCAIVVYV